MRALVLQLGFWMLVAGTAAAIEEQPVSGSVTPSDSATSSLNEVDRALAEIQISGCTAYRSDEIRKALAGDRSVQLLSSPGVPQLELINAIIPLVAKTYRLQGYLDSSVDGVSENGKPAEIRITEGPRYVRGRVIVHCDAEHVSKDVASMLTLGPTDFRTPVAGPDGKMVKEFLGFWRPGDDCLDLTDYPKATEVLVNARLSELGYWFPDLSATLERKPEQGCVNLIVNITNLNDQLPISELQFSGLSHNSSKEVQKILNLQQPISYSGELRRTIINTLENTGRFLEVDVAPEIPFESGVAVPLKIHVVENTAVPPLHESLSEDLESVLRFRNWLTHWEQSGDDLQIEMDVYMSPDEDIDSALSVRNIAHRLLCGSRGMRESRLKLVLSGRRGAVLSVQPMTSHTQGEDRRRCVLSPELSGVYFDDTRLGYRLENVATGVAVITNIKTSSDPEPTEILEYHFSLDQGRKPLASLQFLIDGADILALLESCETVDVDKGIVRARLHISNAVVDFDGKTGRLIDMTLSDESFRFRMSAEQGAFDRELADISEKLHQIPADESKGYMTNAGRLALLQLAHEFRIGQEPELGGLIQKAIDGPIYERLIADLAPQESAPAFPLNSNTANGVSGPSHEQLLTSAMASTYGAMSVLHSGQRRWEFDNSRPTDEQVVEVMESMLNEMSEINSLLRYGITLLRSLTDAEAQRLARLVENGELMGIGKGWSVAPAITLIRNHPETEYEPLRKSLLQALWIMVLKERVTVFTDDRFGELRFHWVYGKAPATPTSADRLIKPVSQSKEEKSVPAKSKGDAPFQKTRMVPGADSNPLSLPEFESFKTQTTNSSN